jgi:hypothetical protein
MNTTDNVRTTQKRQEDVFMESWERLDLIEKMSPTEKAAAEIEIEIQISFS